MKILAGCQFHIKNPRHAPIIGRSEISPIIKNVKKTETIEETNKPSIPSIKLQKLIIPVDNITTKKMK